jgi:hypothetical protein
MHHILLPLLVVVLGAASLLGNELTLDQILSSRFPSESVVSPSGKGFTWVVNDRGVRNIWIAQSPQFEARQITSYDLDDGMELTNLQWCLEESAIVYVRGGAPNSSGELPNPLSDTGGVDRELWKVSVSGDPPILINKGYSPLVHPDGRRMAFLEEKTVKLVDVTAADEEGSFESETILTARGSNHSLRWSPDGKRLAFVSARRGRSFVGALSLGSDSVTWMSASIDRDIEPVWSPDSQAIAFIRLPTRSEIFIFAPYREGYPWSIHVADVVTGQGRQIWQADRGRGSIFYRLPIKNQLLWIGDKIVFPWERDGWAHLYAVSTGGGSPRLLTPGEFEVEDVAVANLKFTSGALGVIEATTTAYPGALKRIEISGSNGTAILEEEDIKMWQFAEETPEDEAIRTRMSGKTESGGGAADPSAISHHGHTMVFEDFITAINENRPPAVDGHEGRRSVEVIRAIYESAKTGQRVQLGS